MIEYLEIDILIFSLSAVISILWTLWIYTSWYDKAKLAEESPFRFLLMIAPGTYLFSITVINWTAPSEIRMDIIGLILLDIITILGAVFLLVAFWYGKQNRKLYLIVLSSYNIGALLIIFSVYLIRIFPPLLIRLSSFIKQLEDFNLLRMSWVALNPENHDQDLISLLNKIIIAVFSYLPISILRILSMNKLRRKTQAELDSLRQRVENLEKKISTVAICE